MNYLLSRNNPHFSFAPQNTINYSNVGAQPNMNGQKDKKSIFEEIKELLSSLVQKVDSLNTSMNSLNTNMINLRYAVKNAKEDVKKSLLKKTEPPSPGNSAYSDQPIPPKNLPKVTGFYRRRNEN